MKGKENIVVKLREGGCNKVMVITWMKLWSLGNLFYESRMGGFKNIGNRILCCLRMYLCLFLRRFFFGGGFIANNSVNFFPAILTCQVVIEGWYMTGLWRGQKLLHSNISICGIYDWLLRWQIYKYLYSLYAVVTDYCGINV